MRPSSSSRANKSTSPLRLALRFTLPNSSFPYVTCTRGLLNSISPRLMSDDNVYALGRKPRCLQSLDLSSVELFARFSPTFHLARKLRFIGSKFDEKVVSQLLLNFFDKRVILRVSICAPPEGKITDDGLAEILLQLPRLEDFEIQGASMSLTSHKFYVQLLSHCNEDTRSTAARILQQKAMMESQCRQELIQNGVLELITSCFRRETRFPERTFTALLKLWTSVVAFSFSPSLLAPQQQQQGAVKFNYHDHLRPDALRILLDIALAKTSNTTSALLLMDEENLLLREAAGVALVSAFFNKNAVRDMFSSSSSQEPEQEEEEEGGEGAECCREVFDHVSYICSREEILRVEKATPQLLQLLVMFNQEGAKGCEKILYPNHNNNSNGGKSLLDFISAFLVVPIAVTAPTPVFGEIRYRVLHDRESVKKSKLIEALVFMTRKRTVRQAAEACESMVLFFLPSSAEQEEVIIQQKKMQTQKSKQDEEEGEGEGEKNNLKEEDQNLQHFLEVPGGVEALVFFLGTIATSISDIQRTCIFSIRNVILGLARAIELDGDENNDNNYYYLGGDVKTRIHEFDKELKLDEHLKVLLLVLQEDTALGVEKKVLEGFATIAKIL